MFEGEIIFDKSTQNIQNLIEPANQSLWRKDFNYLSYLERKIFDERVEVN
jgi:hypothetical protein